MGGGQCFSPHENTYFNLISLNLIEYHSILFQKKNHILSNLIYHPTCRGVGERPSQNQPPWLMSFPNCLFISKLKNGDKKYHTLNIANLDQWDNDFFSVLSQTWSNFTFMLFLSSNKRFSGFKSRWQMEWLKGTNHLDKKTKKQESFLGWGWYTDLNTW